jgi:short-subunit dehydrogenase
MKWAIVTGASSGIGRALAIEFASAGFNVFLTGRNESALNDVAAGCSGKHGVLTEVAAADLSCADSVRRLIAEIQSKPYSYDVLVNNAGFGIHGDFASTDVDENVRLVDVQLTAALQLTRAVLPGMIERRSGKILNVASVYSFSPVPFQSVYAACKAFLLSFSASLQNEVQEKGVTVTVFCPGVTQTEFRSRAGIGQKRKDSGMTAEAAARIAFKATMRGTHIVVPGLVNKVFTFVVGMLPIRSASDLVRFINRQRGQDQ